MTKVPDQQQNENSSVYATSAEPLALRFIYAVLFYWIYAMSRFVLGLIALMQFVHVFFTRQPQQDLTRFSSQLTVYIRQLLDYVTWVSHKKPFPFADWPNLEPKSGTGN